MSAFVPVQRCGELADGTLVHGLCHRQRPTAGRFRASSIDSATGLELHEVAPVCRSCLGRLTGQTVAFELGD